MCYLLKCIKKWGAVVPNCSQITTNAEDRNKGRSKVT